MPRNSAIGRYIAAYLVLHIFSSLMILRFFISIVPEHVVIQTRFIAIITLLFNTGLTLAGFTTLFWLLWLILKYVGLEFSSSDLYSPAIWFLLTACFYELIRLVLATFELGPIMSSLKFSTAEEYIFFIDNELLASRWHSLRRGLDNAYLLICPLFFGLGFRVKLKGDWTDASLCSLIIFSGLFLLKTSLSSFDAY